MKVVYAKKINKNLEFVSSFRNRVERVLKGSNDNKSCFDELLRIYDKIEPQWHAMHNMIEDKKPEIFQSKLDDNIGIEDIINNIDDELVKYALSINVANRIAHSVAFIIKRKIEANLKLNNKYKKGTNSQGISNGEEQIERIYGNMLRYYDRTNAKNQKILDLSEHHINAQGIDSKYFKNPQVSEDKKENWNNFNRKQMEMCFNIINCAFNIKDYALLNLVKHLKEKENKDINYGISKDNHGKERFIIDLPHYGQFSVHLKKVAQQITDRKEIGQEYTPTVETKRQKIDNVAIEIKELLKEQYYGGKLYEHKGVLINKAISEKGNKFFEEISRLKEEDAKVRILDMAQQENIQPERLAHFYKVKYKGENPKKGEENGQTRDF